MTPPKDPIKFEIWRKNNSDKAKLRIGALNPNFGKITSEATRQKMRAKLKGRHLPEEQKQKMRESHKDKPVTEFRRMRIVEGKIGGFWYGNVRYSEIPKYCEKFNEEFKERVRAYWGFQCVLCGAVEIKRRLLIHHVHYDKKMCCNSSPQDVVPLCPSCHPKTNFNRDYWEEEFTTLIYSLDPEGKCFFTQWEMNKFLEQSLVTNEP